MKRLSIFLFAILLFPVLLFSQEFPPFNDYFIDKTMRIDYFHIGDAKEETITIDKIYQYGIWAGNPENLIDRFNNGAYYIKIYDIASNNLIFSKLLAHFVILDELPLIKVNNVKGGRGNW